MTQGEAAWLLTAEDVLGSFRHLTPELHPILQVTSRDRIYDEGNWMAPGGLLLADRMAKQLSVCAGERVLDLGCGRGQSSVFLASMHGAEVVSLDLWVSASERQQAAVQASVGGLVTPMQGDIARGLPAGLGGFDAIFCMQSFHCFGTRASVVRYLASLLRPGGRICFAQGCFREEPAPLPALFQETDRWHAEYEKYHSPGWWRNHVTASGFFDVTTAEEIEEGQVIWEDDVLYRGDRAGWSDAFLSSSQWLIRQIAHGQTSSPTLTHCIVCAKRKA